MKTLILYIACFFCVSNTYSQNITLVKDINKGPGSSNPEILGVFSNGLTIFRADDSVHGYELWVTDRTTNGTQLLKDINPNGDGTSRWSTKQSFFVNDKLFFIADDGITGSELWISDGTAKGTEIVKDIYPGSHSSVSSQINFAYLNNEVYFNARSGFQNYELWKTDGTEAGTKLVKEIYPNEHGSDPTGIVTALGKIYFAANDSIHGRELWVTDGTISGTKMVGNLRSGSLPASPSLMTEYNGKLYFSALADLTMGIELYSTDGINISLVKDIRVNGHSSPKGLTVVGNKLYFSARNKDYLNDLWVTDGTTIGTRLVRSFSGNNHIRYIYGEVNGKVILSADEYGGHVLWTSDGTENGTKKLRDINTDNYMLTYSTTSERQKMNRMTPNVKYISNDVFYFCGYDYINDAELYRTDGTAAGTYIVENVGVKPTIGASSTPQYIYISGRIIWLSMTDGENGHELYKYTIQPAHIQEEVVSEISLAPNPTSGNFQVRLGTNSFNNGYLKVTDISGRVVYDQGIATGARHISVPLSNQPTGVYVVTVNLDNRISSETITIE